MEDTPDYEKELTDLNDFEADMVNNPSHYQGQGLEAIDVIESFNLGFNIGNVIKYLLRAGKKGIYIQDLQKAQWYLNREISKVNKYE
jgi:hypothetical protein